MFQKNGWKTVPILKLWLNKCVIIFSLMIWFQQARVSVSNSDRSVTVLNMGLIPLRSSGGTELDNYISWAIVWCGCPEIQGGLSLWRLRIMLNCHRLEQDTWIFLCWELHACKDFQRENCVLQGNCNVKNLVKDKSWDFELALRKYLIRTYADRPKDTNIFWWPRYLILLEQMFFFLFFLKFF